MNIYIDECGNTGDISVKGVNQQPFFVLSAIHIDNDLSKEIAEIENRYRSNKKIQQLEIKSSNTYSSQIIFTSDILNLIHDKKAQIWCEVMDKKYYVIVNLVTFTILQVWTQKRITELDQYVLNSLADYLDKEFSIEELDPFLIACKHPTRDNLRHLYHYFQNALRDRAACEERDAILLSIGNLIKEINDPNDPFEDSQYYPIPDYTKHGKKLIMLPYVQAFANLLARINKWIKLKNINKVKIIHDEQCQFDEIISFYKEFCESPSNILKNINQFNSASDFHFENTIQLSFVDSKSEKNLQYADLVAGFTTRAIIEKCKNKLNNKYSILLHNMLTSPMDISTGFNMVASGSRIKEILG